MVQLLDSDTFLAPNLRNFIVVQAHLPGLNSTTGAVFYTTNLSGSCLQGACLRESNFYRAKLSRSGCAQGAFCQRHLIGADLGWLNLAGAILRSACLSMADLTGVILHQAFLQGVNAPKAVLTHAVLMGANLVNANLAYACLDYAEWGA